MTAAEPLATVIHEMVVSDIDRAAKHLNPLVIHTADWQHSDDPEQRMLFYAAHDLMGTLASIRTGVGLLNDEVMKGSDERD